MTIFTVFCQQANGEGTIWIDNLEAENLQDAKLKGRIACSESWLCSTDDIRVLGVAEGDVTILFWEDLVDEITGFEGYGT